MLAWACPVHKVQGKQFTDVVIRFKLHKQRSFNYGQMYVVLSRVISLGGLFLVDEYSRSAIRANPKATNEYELLRKDYVVEPIEDCDLLADSTLTVTLLNIRSFLKHAVDIVHDNILMESDVICLTETQIEIDSDTSSISEMFTDFNICHNKERETNFVVSQVVGEGH